MFFDNNRILHVKIEERQPVARVFTDLGGSFYIDSNGLRLPLSEKLSARVPVITNFPSDNAILSQPDSALLLNVVKLGKYIKADSFWMAQVSQIVITPQATFEMIPVIGDQVIELGNADDLDNKFNRLYTFYRQAWLQNGMNTYEKIYVQFSDQVVAVKRGLTGALADSLQTGRSVKGVVKGQVITAAAGPGSGLPAIFNNNRSLNKNFNDSLKNHFKGIRKNVIGVKQNKVVNKSLHHSHVPTTPVKQQIPSARNKPKAIMGKE
jgi:cell division protein FtsQ